MDLSRSSRGINSIPLGRKVKHSAAVVPSATNNESSACFCRSSSPTKCVADARRLLLRLITYVAVQPDVLRPLHLEKRVACSRNR